MTIIDTEEKGASDSICKGADTLSRLLTRT